jgi:hypothetical protein
MKLSNSAALTTLGLIILAVLGWRGTDVSGSVVALIASYTASRAAQKTGMVFASSKDGESKTDEIIEKLK